MPVAQCRGGQACPAALCPLSAPPIACAAVQTPSQYQISHVWECRLTMRLHEALPDSRKSAGSDMVVMIYKPWESAPVVGAGGRLRFLFQPVIVAVHACDSAHAVQRQRRAVTLHPVTCRSDQQESPFCRQLLHPE